eukprot:TRINITY_DN7119_c0_g1_i2.p1 TRINITY_DN7119_c0_g1~~TRINITY_DN7119_c0_g1_i2.p1  ORF type:complete len:622 (+),score=130.34 TRINITY_DN7119_c0_g1_i2:41-1906(+)
MSCRRPSKSKTSSFVQLRQKKKEKKEKEQMRLFSNYNLASHDWSENAQKKSKSFYDIHDNLIQGDELKHCHLCQSGFSIFSARKRCQCPVCKHIVCSECRKYKLVGSGMTVCTRCFKYLAHKKVLKKFRKKIARANDGRFIILYNTVMSLVEQIRTEMPQFLGNVSLLVQGKEENMITFDVRTFDELKGNALSLIDTLESYFTNIRTRLKKINNLPFNSEREILIKKHIIISVNNFLEGKLPKFKVASQQLDSVLSDPDFRSRVEQAEKDRIEEEKMRKREKKKRELEKKSNTRANQRTQTQGIFEKLGGFLKTMEPEQIQTAQTNQPLSISFVKPALVSTTGGVRITIEGTNFREGLIVHIGEIRVRNEHVVLDKEHGNLIVNVVTPPNSEGQKDIKITNPDKKSAVLKGVLMYINDPSLFQSLESHQPTNIIDNQISDSDSVEERNNIYHNTDNPSNPFDDSSEEVIAPKRKVHTRDIASPIKRSRIEPSPTKQRAPVEKTIPKETVTPSPTKQRSKIEELRKYKKELKKKKEKESFETELKTEYNHGKEEQRVRNPFDSDSSDAQIPRNTRDYSRNPFADSDSHKGTTEISNNPFSSEEDDFPQEKPTQTPSTNPFDF